MGIKIYEELEQGTPEWLEARLGIVTASVAKNLLTSTFKVSKDKKVNAYAMEVASERITGRNVPLHQTWDMERGHLEEVLARDLYSERYAEAREVGFITNDWLGFKVGFSPDGLVGDDGIIEIKSRLPKYQVQTFVNGGVPSEFMVQCQFGMMVSGRDWCHFVSYSNGMPMYVHKVLPDPVIVEALKEALFLFEEKVKEIHHRFVDASHGYPHTEWVDHFTEQDIEV